MYIWEAPFKADSSAGWAGRVQPLLAKEAGFCMRFRKGREEGEFKASFDKPGIPGKCSGPFPSNELFLDS